MNARRANASGANQPRQETPRPAAEIPAIISAMPPDVANAPETPDAWADAALAAVLLAVDPVGLGGIALRARSGPVRDIWQDQFRKLLNTDMPVRRLPSGIADDRLLGGLDIPATLRAGRPIADRGLLAEADGGIVFVPMAERLSGAIAARLARVLDTGEVIMERDGLASRSHSRIGIVAYDESAQDDEPPPRALTDRLAFHPSLEGVRLGGAADFGFEPALLPAARLRLKNTVAGADAAQALCELALALGIASLRAPLLALRAARAHAAWRAAERVEQADLLVAARLVLAPRATQLPAAEPETQPPPPEPPPDEPDDPATPPAEQDLLDRDILLNAAKAAIPQGLLDRLRAASASAAMSTNAGQAGALQTSLKRGRPAGVRAGTPRSGARLSIIATLRAAAPWQKLRQQDDRTMRAGHGAVIVQPEDFRVSRFKQRTESVTIFIVDASGSTALNRLAEAKGAVELLLADCYVRRDQVAMIAFRGRGADVLLPPTRSLTRAKRSLAGLPGGGGTPLAAGLDEGLRLAESVRRKGQTPILVLLTDGRANVARDGTGGRILASEDAAAAARMVHQSAYRAVLIDVSPRAGEAGRQLAAVMNAIYLPLPFANAADLSQAVRVISTARSN
jgi:magnesium chelatase subunit D